MLNTYAPGIVSLREAMDMPNVLLELAYDVALHDSQVASALSQHGIDVATMMQELKHATRP